MVRGDVTEAYMRELLPFTNYDCYVTASSSVGEGPPSNVRTQRTVESGESKLNGLRDDAHFGLRAAHCYVYDNNHPSIYTKST